jgi:hypothetical protein
MDSERCPIRFGTGDRNLCFSVDREDESGADTLLLELINTSKNDYVLVFKNFSSRQTALYIQAPDECQPFKLAGKTRASFEVTATLLNPSVSICRSFDFSYTNDMHFDGTYVISLTPERAGGLRWKHNMRFRTYLPRNVLMGSAIFLSFRMLTLEDWDSDDEDSDDFDDDDDDDDASDSAW